MGEVEHLRAELKRTVRICGVEGTVDLKSAARYLTVHGSLPKLQEWNAQIQLPVLTNENDRLKISQNSEKTLDN